MEDPNRICWRCTASVTSEVWGRLSVARDKDGRPPRGPCSVCIITFIVFVLFCYNLMHVRCFGWVINTCAPPHSVWPHLFCGAGHEKRRGEQLKWSLAFRLYIESFVFHVHSYQDQFIQIQPGWAECVLFSLCLYFVCLFCFNLFVYPHPFVFPWAVESSPLQVLALA